MEESLPIHAFPQSIGIGRLLPFCFIHLRKLFIMSTLKNILLSAVLAIAFMSAKAAESSVAVEISNPISLERAMEMVEIPLESLEKKLGTASGFIVTDADGREVPSQLTYDGKLIFQASVGARSKSVYHVKQGTPAKYETKVFGRIYLDRLDDFAWENDRVGYRAYGPAIQRRGDRLYGYDIFNKRTTALVVEGFYESELDPALWKIVNKLRREGHGDLADDVYNAISYHVDHGKGMDCYKVGPTLGAGTSALIENGGKDIVYPKCYTSCDILESGPLRLTFRLTFAPEKVNGVDVVETRTVTLDAGSHFNRAVISYSGLTSATPVAAGIVVHNENPSAYVLNAKAGYIGYEDLGDPYSYKEKYRKKQNPQMGRIFIGTVFPEDLGSAEYRAFTKEELPRRGSGACGHLLGISTLKPGTDFTYYFGSGWNRNSETGIASLTDWEQLLSRFAQCVRKPLKVKIR